MSVKLSIDQIEQVHKLVAQELDFVLSGQLETMEMNTPELKVKTYRMTDRQIRVDVVEIN